MSDEYCLVFPRPIFFELGKFGSSSEIQQRLIKNKYIYAITSFDPFKCDKFITDDKGMIFFEKEKEIFPNTFVLDKMFAVIHPGQYYFFVSKYKVLDYSFFSVDNCTPLIEITTEWNQLTSLPYPMCAHNNGAENVANYILDEIKNNSRSKEVEEIKKLNSNLKTKIIAKGKWTLLVAPNKKWDHKPYISGKKTIVNNEKYNMVKNSVNRPINKNGDLIKNSVYHKYNNHDYFYDVWSNIHYGYIGKSCGFSNDTLLDGAGSAQFFSDIISMITSLDFSKHPKIHSTNVSGMRKYDDVLDQMSVLIGILLFEKTNGNVEMLTVNIILNALETFGNLGLLGDNRLKHICIDDNTFTPD